MLIKISEDHQSYGISLKYKFLNYFENKIVEDKHDFRSIADPKRCYIDGRIEILE